MTGRWTDQDVDAEFRKVTTAWQSAKDALDSLRELVSGLRRRKGVTEIQKELAQLEQDVAAWNRPIAWSERSSATSVLTGVGSSVERLRGPATTFRAEDDAAKEKEQADKAERARKHEALMEQQQADKRARLEREAAEARAAREAEQAEEARRAEAEAKAERQRVADREERARLEQEERQRKREEAERQKREEEERRQREAAEQARREQEEREGPGREAWRTALEDLARQTDPNVVATVEKLKTMPSRLAELERLLATERRDIEAAGWPVGAVQALTAGTALRDRWAAHQLDLANAPRQEYETNMARFGAPPTKLGIDAAKLWTFLGYPEAHGRDYAMPKFEKFGTKYHFSLTGNSMNDLSVLWKADRTILAQHPEAIFTALFETGVAADRRIHITREADRAHVYLGDATGAGRAIGDYEFGGDAAVMKAELRRLKEEIIAKLWEAKQRRWVLT